MFGSPLLETLVVRNGSGVKVGNQKELPLDRNAKGIETGGQEQPEGN
jgi:hypothetical protein